MWWVKRQRDDEDGETTVGAAATSADETDTSTSKASETGDETTANTSKSFPAVSEQTGTLSHPRIPTEIPRAPDIAVDHDALTDEASIGSGGNADVIRATLPTDEGGVTLALKHPRFATDETITSDDVAKFLEEAETWEQIDDHDHVVGVVDYGSNSLPWIAMEYMDGGNLGDRIGEMDRDQALWTAVAVSNGVRHAHRHGIAHLDLKPENVLFREVDGAWDVPKVGDWGLSKHLLEHSMSVDGLSPKYAAPEQFEEEYGATDDITDIYQLGAVFYELFTGRPPFEGSAAKVMRKVLTEEPEPPTAIDPSLPAGLDEVLLTALAKDRADRYEGVLYLRDGLRELFDEY
jgi:serine/threonine protein kinase